MEREAAWLPDWQNKVEIKSVQHKKLLKYVCEIKSLICLTHCGQLEVMVKPDAKDEQMQMPSVPKIPGSIPGLSLFLGALYQSIQK